MHNLAAWIQQNARPAVLLPRDPAVGQAEITCPDLLLKTASPFFEALLETDLPRRGDGVVLVPTHFSHAVLEMVASYLLKCQAEIAEPGFWRRDAVSARLPPVEELSFYEDEEKKEKPADLANADLEVLDAAHQLSLPSLLRDYCEKVLLERGKLSILVCDRLFLFGEYELALDLFAGTMYELTERMDFISLHQLNAAGLRALLRHLYKLQLNSKYGAEAFFPKWLESHHDEEATKPERFATGLRKVTNACDTLEAPPCLVLTGQLGFAPQQCVFAGQVVFTASSCQDFVQISPTHELFALIRPEVRLHLADGTCELAALERTQCRLDGWECRVTRKPVTTWEVAYPLRLDALVAPVLPQVLGPHPAAAVIDALPPSYLVYASYVREAVAKVCSDPAAFEKYVRIQSEKRGKSFVPVRDEFSRA